MASLGGQGYSIQDESLVTFSKVVIRAAPGTVIRSGNKTAARRTSFPKINFDTVSKSPAAAGIAQMPPTFAEAEGVEEMQTDVDAGTGSWPGIMWSRFCETL